MQKILSDNTDADGGFLTTRGLVRRSAARCEARTPPWFSSENRVCRAFFLPECRQRCCLLQRRSLTGITQLLLAVRVQAGAGRCGAALSVLKCNLSAPNRPSGPPSAERRRPPRFMTFYIHPRACFLSRDPILTPSQTLFNSSF